MISCKINPDQKVVDLLILIFKKNKRFDKSIKVIPLAQDCH
jgi:hypothetical protein